MKSLRSFLVVFGLAGALLFGTTAHGALIMEVSDGTSTQTYQDSNGDGVLANVSFALGSWSVVISAALSKPIIGSESEAALDLTVVAASIGAGTLTVRVTDSDYTLNPPQDTMSVSSSVGGTTTGTVEFAAYYSASNTEFSTSGLIGTLGPLDPIGSAFSGDLGTATVPFASPLSITLESVVTHAGPGYTSFDLHAVAHVPEPATVLLMGLGCGGVGLAAMRRRRRQKSEAAAP